MCMSGSWKVVQQFKECLQYQTIQPRTQHWENIATPVCYLEYNRYEDSSIDAVFFSLFEDFIPTGNWRPERIL